jgi:hypothetical protein
MIKTFLPPNNGGIGAGLEHFPFTALPGKCANDLLGRASLSGQMMPFAWILR